jgi:phenylpyruvate tautomerase PptA (4-oxalocrotonate tautomerase family)
MPLVKITSSATLNDDGKRALLGELSRLVAGRLGKPESYVMTAFDSAAVMTFAGTPEPAAYVELKSIGTFTPEATANLSSDLCQALEKALGVPAGRIYIEFADAKGYLWGHDGETF